MMGMVSQAAFKRIDKSVESGNDSARALVSYFVGQGVGMIDAVKSAGQVVQDFKTDFADAYLGFTSLMDE